MANLILHKRMSIAQYNTFKTLHTVNGVLDDEFKNTLFVLNETGTFTGTDDCLFYMGEHLISYASYKKALALSASSTDNEFPTAKCVYDAVKNKADSATTLSGYGITDAYTKTEVDSKLTTVYKAAGSAATVSALGSLDAQHEGFVYNMSAAFETTSNFVEGAGKSYSAGTNVVIVNTGTIASPVYKYDILAGETLGNSKIFYGTCDSAANNTEKAVICPEFTTNSLVDGVMIIVKFSNTNSAAVASLQLNVNSTGAYDIKKVYSTNSSNAGLKSLTQVAEISADSVIPFIFNGTYWVVAGVDMNYTYTMNYSVDAGKYKAGTGDYAVSRYSLLMQKLDGTWEKITNTGVNYSVSTDKTVNTNGFLLNQIVYYGTKTNFGNGALIDSNICYRKSASVDLRYSINCGNSPSWNIGDYIYLVGALHSDGLFYLDTTTWWTNTLPSTNDGKLYIRLGLVLDTLYTISFLDNRPIFYHDGISIREYYGIDKPNSIVRYDDEIISISDFDPVKLVYTDLSMQDIHGFHRLTRETANSYVISSPGYYMLPLVYGNAIVNGKTNTPSYTNLGGTYQADFVNYKGNAISSPYIETDTEETVTSARLEISDTDNIISNIEVKTDVVENIKFLCFKVLAVPSTGANAVLSILDDESNVMWSWHIWLWKESLDPITITNHEGNNYKILPVNLGSKYDEDGIHLKNWFYQWGRKDPMLCSESYNSNTDITSYGSSSFSISNVASNVSDAIKNPCTFYKRDGNYKYNWVQLNYFYNYWDASCGSTGFTEKTITKTVYDPCPPGYSIPNARVFTGFTTTGNYIEWGDNVTEEEFMASINVSGSWDSGWNFKTANGSSSFFPASGYRGDDIGGIYELGLVGNYWSAGAASEYDASQLYFNSDNVNPLSNNYRAGCCSVRPVFAS